MTNPIQSWIESNNTPDSPLGLNVILSMHYPDADADGLPDKPRVLVLAWQPTGATTTNGQNIEDLSALSGVYMLPAYRFQKPISEIPQAVKDEVKTRLQNNGIPLSALSGIEVYGDFLRKVAKYFSVSHQGFGRHVEVDSDLEFE